MNKTAHSFAVTFEKDKWDDAVIWVEEEGQFEPDELTDVEWSEARDALPMPEQLDTLIAAHPHGLLVYEKDFNSWSEY